MDRVETPRIFATDAADRPRRWRCAARPLALKRRLALADSSPGAAAAALRDNLPTCLTCCSSACRRRFNSAICERYWETAFFSDWVSLRVSLRATRAISDLRTEAILDMGSSLTNWAEPRRFLSPALCPLGLHRAILALPRGRSRRGHITRLLARRLTLFRP